MLKTLLDRPITVTMALLVIVVLGVVSIGRLPVSLIPNVQIPYVTVQVDAPNLSAREVDEAVVNPLRQQLIQIGALENLTTESRDGSGTVKLTFNHGADIDYLFIEVNEKIDRSLSSLPNIPRPKVLKASATDIPAFYVDMTLKKDASSPEDPLFPVSAAFTEMSRFAREVVSKRIEQLDEVAMVDASGGVSPEILIIPDKEKLLQMGMDLRGFESVVNGANVQLGSLTIRDGQYRYNVKFQSYAGDLHDIENVWFKTAGRMLQIKDVARVVEHPAKRTGMVRSGGKPAICMAVIKQSDARMSDLRKAMDRQLRYFEWDYPEVHFEVTRDQTQLLEYSIHNLIQNIVLGVLLACLVIFLFMRDFRSPALVSLTMPTALIFSMLAFKAFGLSLNIISLSGLLLGVGMMADNTIILVDNITGRWQRDCRLREAVLEGTKEVMGPMLSSMLTTCAVFLPLVFLSGIAGALFYDQAMAVTIVLLTSYVITVTVIPVYYWWLYRKKPAFRSHPLLDRINFNEPLQRWDDRTMSWFLRRRWFSWSCLLLALAGTFVCFRYMPKERLPEITYTETLLKIDWNEHLSLEQNEARTAALEQVIGEQGRQVTALVGTQQFVLSHSGDQGPSETTLYIKCDDLHALETVKSALSGRLSADYPGCRFRFDAAGNIFDMVFASSEAPLTARLRPVSSAEIEVEKLQKVREKIARALPDVPLPPLPLKTDVLFVAEPDRMALYGVSYEELASILKNALNENRLFNIVQGNQTLPVVMGVDRQELGTMLSETFINRTRNGEDIRIPVSSLMRQTWKEDLKSIVSGAEGNYYPLDLAVTARQARETVRTVERTVREDGDFEAGFSGSLFTNRKMMQEMILILLVAVILLYLILASQFESLVQPLIILSEIIIDIFASLLFLWVMGVSINLMSLIGLVVVCGIVINDSILKIDTINRLRRAGLELKHAVMLAGRRRMKAILMTSLTTIFAVCPFLARGSMGADLQYPMSLVIIAGMTVGTLVSLFLVPALYFSIYKRQG